jgi:6-phosphogluconolactonase
MLISFDNPPGHLGKRQRTGALQDAGANGGGLRERAASWSAAALRRLVLAVTAIFAVAAPAKEFFVFFGTYTNELSRGIYVSRLDAGTGKLSAPELAAETPSPCYLAVSPDEKFLYAANSVKNFSDYSVSNGGAVSAFAIDRASGRLALLNQKCSGGAGPCHVSVDASGKVLFVANYGSGSVKSFLLETNGAIGADGSFFQHVGSSVNTNRQASAHAHCITADPSDRFALACDLGTDRVMIYTLNTNSAELDVQSGFSTTAVPPGSGARHLAFSRDGKFVYVVNEIACTVTTFAWDSEKGKLSLVETVSALPPAVAVEANFTAAEILVHPAGKFVYATVRGHDSVSVFAADARTGRLTFLQTISAGGQVPRGLGIDPTGRWLITGNQKSGNAVEFAIDAATGKLAATGRELKIGSPVDVKFVTSN